MDKRCYFVIDMKSFFASVECSLRNLNPLTTDLVVADSDRTEKTICLAVSPSLKAQGVKNRCRLFEIPKNLKYIIAKPQMKKYIEYAAKIYAIYLQYISKDDIHVYSIDECFLDVTDYLKIYNIRAKAFAKKLMDEIYDKLMIPATCGIGTNMYLAKIALDITAKNSKDRIGWLDEEKFKRDLWYHEPITDFWRISTGISNRLYSHGIYNMHDLSLADEDMLYKEFGVNAELLIDHSKGIETCTMYDIKHYKGKSKSISSSQILASSYTKDEARTIIKEMIQDGCYRLMSADLVAGGISIGIRYDDHTGTQGQKKMLINTNIYSKIIPYVLDLYNEIVDKNKHVKGLGYGFTYLNKSSHEHYDIFTDNDEVVKLKELDKAVLIIKNKFGKNSILKGIDYMPEATQRERNMQIGGHNSGERKDVKK